eukprot:m.338345 g.338345  ORF g.338345 m.338345 type:complete len:291 (+) comp18388_c0_seq1:57-929(+)
MDNTQNAKPLKQFLAQNTHLSDEEITWMLCPEPSLSSSCTPAPEPEELPHVDFIGVPSMEVTVSQPSPYDLFATTNVDGFLMASHPLFPYLLRLIKRVYCALLGQPYLGSPHSVDEDFQEFGSDYEILQLVKNPYELNSHLTQFLIMSLGIYYNILRRLQKIQLYVQARRENNTAKLMQSLNMIKNKHFLQMKAKVDLNVKERHQNSRHQSQKLLSPTTIPSINKKQRTTLPKAATDCLKAWLFQHRDAPYPNDDDKDELILKTGLTVRQVNNWFINARRRILPYNSRRN